MHSPPDLKFQRAAPRRNAPRSFHLLRLKCETCAKVSTTALWHALSFLLWHEWTAKSLILIHLYVQFYICIQVVSLFHTCPIAQYILYNSCSPLFIYHIFLHIWYGPINFNRHNLCKKRYTVGSMHEQPRKKASLKCFVWITIFTRLRWVARRHHRWKVSAGLSLPTLSRPWQKWMTWATYLVDILWEKPVICCWVSGASFGFCFHNTNFGQV